MDHFAITFDRLFAVWLIAIIVIEEGLKTKGQTTTSAQSLGSYLCLIHEVVATSNAKSFELG